MIPRTTMAAPTSRNVMTATSVVVMPLSSDGSKSNRAQK